MFKNHQKCPIFHLFLVLLKLTCLVTLFDCKLKVFKNSPNCTILGIFDKLLFTQNVNVARFARNVELNATFSVIFKHDAIVYQGHKSNKCLEDA